jgi:hypothetical protein
LEKNEVPKGGNLRMKLDKAYSNIEIHSYEDTPMKRTFRDMTQWAPIMAGQEAPDFEMMERVAFSSLDDTTFPAPDRYNPDNVPAPSGHGYRHDDPKTAHYLGGVLQDISPELHKLYHGGAHNLKPVHEYRNTRVPSYVILW